MRRCRGGRRACGLRDDPAVVDRNARRLLSCRFSWSAARVTVEPAAYPTGQGRGQEDSHQELQRPHQQAERNPARAASREVVYEMATSRSVSI